MKKVLSIFGVSALVLALPLAVGAAKAGAQNSDNSPNELSGDGIRNVLQDEEFGQYGEGESPNELSGDGIPNRTQDEEFGQYGTDTASENAQAKQYMGDDVPQAQNQEQVQTQNKGEETMLRVTHTAMNNAELEGAMQQIRQEVREERGGEGGTRAEVRGEREDAEVAMRAMVAAGPMMGSAEQQMTRLANQVGEQSEKALANETKMRDRSGFVRFFAGGDDEAADEVLQAVAQNRETIREMHQLVEDCEQCDEAARETLREQIRVMEDEQTRIEEAANEEKGKRGLFGFLFGWLVD